jgi:ABC-type enterobactin transport system permease subunit
VKPFGLPLPRQRGNVAVVYAVASLALEEAIHGIGPVNNLALVAPPLASQLAQGFSDVVHIAKAFRTMTAQVVLVDADQALLDATAMVAASLPIPPDQMLLKGSMPARTLFRKTR